MTYIARNDANIVSTSSDTYHIPASMTRPPSHERPTLTVATAGADTRVPAGIAALESKRLPELDLEYEPENGLLWQFMRPQGRPSFTPGLLRDMTHALDIVENSFKERAADQPPVEFLVLASKMPGIFNLGGDLPRFIELMEAGDRATLTQYAHICARGQYRRAIDLNLPICTIALVQGDTLGGGFEAALAHDVIIAEKGASFGLPEILFNLFPGMGAYSFLSRRLDPARAERMILSGRLYSAEELHEIGVVDHLAERGAGVEATYAFIRDYKRSRFSRQAVLQARRVVNPIDLDELVRIADIWVDTAFRLGPAERRRMAHLAKAQDRRWAKIRPAGEADVQSPAPLRQAS